MLINGNGGNGWQSFLTIGTTPPPSIRLHRLKSENSITYLKNCLSIFIFIPVSFFPLLLCISTKSKTKLKKNLIWTSDQIKWNTCSQTYKRHSIFLWTLVLRGQSKWRTNKNEHGEGDNPLLKVRCKSKK